MNLINNNSFSALDYSKKNNNTQFANRNFKSASSINIDSVHFQGRNNIFKEMIKPTYIEPEKVQLLADKFSSGLFKLYRQNNLNISSVKSLVKEIAPEFRIKIFDMKKRNDLEGYMTQNSFLGLKLTKIFFPFEYLKDKNNKKAERCAANVIAHEFTHSLRYNTKAGSQAIMDIYKDLQYGKLYNKSQYKLFNTKFYHNWKNAKPDANKTKILERMLDSSLKNNHVNGVEEKLELMLNLYFDSKAKSKQQNVIEQKIDSLFQKYERYKKIIHLKTLYYDTLAESEAYKNGDTLEIKLHRKKENAKIDLRYIDMYNSFAEVVKNRYIKEGGDPSKLNF